MTPRRLRRHRFWALLTATLLVVALIAGALLESRTTLRAFRLHLGLVAALLFVFAVLLGWRRRRPALALGSLSAWTTAHLWLGTLSLSLALLHTRFRADSVVGVALLVCLALVVLSGFGGVLLQSIIPRLMTSRLPEESPLDDVLPLFVERARSVTELVERTCNGSAGSAAGRAALREFHSTSIAPFF